jgi:hypothetical protein
VVEPEARIAMLARLSAPAGLCADCVHLRVATSPRSAFVRCALADRDPRFARYPPLPVTECSGWRRLDG